MQDVKLLEWINVEIIMWKCKVWPARELLWRNRTMGKWNCLMRKGLGLFWDRILDWRSFIAWAVRILDFPKFIGKSMFQLKTISRCDSVTLNLYLVFSSALAVTRDTEHFLFNHARALKISDTDLGKKLISGASRHLGKQHPTCPTVPEQHLKLFM